MLFLAFLVFAPLVLCADAEAGKITALSATTPEKIEEWTVGKVLAAVQWIQKEMEDGKEIPDVAELPNYNAFKTRILEFLTADEPNPNPKRAELQAAKELVEPLRSKLSAAHLKASLNGDFNSLTNKPKK